MSPRTGRPPSDNPRTEIRRVRLTADEDAAIKAAADKAGKTVADWLRTLAVNAALPPRRKPRPRRPD